MACVAVNGDCANQVVFLEHRHDEIGSGPGNVGYFDNGGIALKICRQGSNIFDVDHLVGSSNGAETTLRVRLERRER